MIRTPTDLIAYLKALFMQNPLVMTVITGEQMRPEESTLNNARYPQVDIETPTVDYPIPDVPLTMHTRIWITKDVEAGKHSDIDQATDVCYRIGKSALDTIKEHSYGSDIDIAMSGKAIELNPVEGKGSDQVRGWVLELMVEADGTLCEDDALVKPDNVIIPMFSWENDSEQEQGLSITIEDRTIHAGSHTDHDVDWYWQEEIFQPEATTFNPGDGFEVPAIQDGPGTRTAHVWLRIRLNTLNRDLWAYAEINTGRTAGRSVPFMPFYPY